jgi:hypothetical protein
VMWRNADRLFHTQLDAAPTVNGKRSKVLA